MTAISHRVRIFVFRFGTEQVEYLLGRARPRAEALWGPLVGPIRPNEDAERAALRSAREEAGIEHAEALFDLQAPELVRVGDLSLVEWAYGMRVARAETGALVVGADWGDLLWESFPSAYRRIGLEANRRAMLRLHTLLSS
jgi:ADP-ribose pyrophosphatase YjhB (NUDIX family)